MALSLSDPSISSSSLLTLLYNIDGSSETICVTAVICSGKVVVFRHVYDALCSMKAPHCHSSIPEIGIHISKAESELFTFSELLPLLVNYCPVECIIVLFYGAKVMGDVNYCPVE
ncbi:hypothetical protein M9H77_04369 [Catharanthus roseus]|uniref:Uncharacterized protein n=1 Tax=Catharanthus roseus TaxID=4058 RepID=A0ACC0CEE0_CATRO|nr:hypothetical protein M9H77_04369 [Catharanthus roseus]